MRGRKRKIQTAFKPAPRRVAAALFAWYDENARVLPWRVGPRERAAGISPDPYVVWLSEVMLQQTTVAAVAPRFREFLELWPTVEALAAAPVEEVLAAWAGLGYYARARNLHKCARAVAAQGDFPDTEEGLRALPGIGAYTAAAIAAIAFDRPAIVVDGNVERVMARLFAIETPLPAAKPHLKETAASVWPQQRSGDFAQGLMDLGATLCTPRNPDCGACPVKFACLARKRGEAAEFPKRAPKKERPTRYGVAYALFNARGEILLERRPAKGLLAGCLGLPGTEWVAAREAAAPAAARGAFEKAGRVRHTFTHFHLELDVLVGAGAGASAEAQVWVDAETVRLPTVMKKALDAALGCRAGLFDRK